LSQFNRVIGEVRRSLFRNWWVARHRAPLAVVASVFCGRGSANRRCSRGGHWLCSLTCICGSDPARPRLSVLPAEHVIPVTEGRGRSCPAIDRHHHCPCVGRESESAVEREFMHPQPTRQPPCTGSLTRFSP